MMDCRPVDPPVIINHGLQILKGAQEVDRERYHRIIGKLIYLSYTRQDISYAIGIMSLFMHKLQVQHIKVVIQILRYLKGFGGEGIMFKRNIPSYSSY